jgi:hypothetical protein
MDIHIAVEGRHDLAGQITGNCARASSKGV